MSLHSLQLQSKSNNVIFPANFSSAIILWLLLPVVSEDYYTLFHPPQPPVADDVST
jgi:hypothetical protein